MASRRRPTQAGRRDRPQISPHDLPRITRELHRRMRARAPMNYQRGRARLREELMEVLDCTPVRAEHIVSSLVARGYARFTPHPQYATDRTIGLWKLDPAPVAET
jgi:hypothetical protein